MELHHVALQLATTGSVQRHTCLTGQGVHNSNQGIATNSTAATAASFPLAPNERHSQTRTFVHRTAPEGLHYISVYRVSTVHCGLRCGNRDTRSAQRVWQARHTRFIGDSSAHVFVRCTSAAIPVIICHTREEEGNQLESLLARRPCNRSASQELHANVTPSGREGVTLSQHVHQGGCVRLARGHSAFTFFLCEQTPDRSGRQKKPLAAAVGARGFRLRTSLQQLYYIHTCISLSRPPA